MWIYENREARTKSQKIKSMIRMYKVTQHYTLMSIFTCMLSDTVRCSEVRTLRLHRVSFFSSDKEFLRVLRLSILCIIVQFFILISFPTAFVQESCYAAVAPVTMPESSKHSTTLELLQNSRTLELLQHRGQNF